MRNAHTAIGLLLAAVTAVGACDSLEAPTDVEVQLAKGGNGNGNGNGNDGGPPGGEELGVWDGTQEIIYRTDGRLEVVAPDGFNRALVFTAAEGLTVGDAEITADGNAIYFQYDHAVHVITRDPITSEISAPTSLFTFAGPTADMTLSPDETMIAWVDVRPCGQVITAIDVFVYDIATAASTRITSNNDCVSEPEATNREPAWVSNTELAMLMRPASGNPSPTARHVAIFDIGNLEDADQDGVIDTLTQLQSSLGTQPDDIFSTLEWAPDARRGVVQIANPWDLWLVDFSTQVPTWCNLTEALDGTVRDPTLGPNGQIAFTMTPRKIRHLYVGTIAEGCPTEIAFGDPTVEGKRNAGIFGPKWRRPAS